jgi:hypothetical protein
VPVLVAPPQRPRRLDDVDTKPSLSKRAGFTSQLGTSHRWTQPTPQFTDLSSAAFVVF